MTKKILLIIGILVVVGVAAFLIFYSSPATNGEGSVGFSIRDYLPFGSSSNNGSGNGSAGTNNATTSETNTGSTTENPIINQENQPIPKLRKLSNEPIAGAIIFNTGTTSVVRFIEKGTGNVYEAKSNTFVIERLTNTTIPKIIRAFWLPNGSGFLAQTLLIESETIETSFVKLNKNKVSSTSEDLTPYSTIIGKLPTGIKEIAIKPDSAKIFYYIADNSSNWFVSNPDGTGSSLVMTHPLTEWIPQWISGNNVIMQTKGSSQSVGHTYTFDVSSKTLKKIGVGMSGLSTNTNTDGSLSLISGGDTYPQLFVVKNKDASKTNISINTLAEKCVWLKDKNPSIYCAIPRNLPSGNYPDIWYKGLVSTNDYIAKIDLSNDISYNIADLPVLSGQKIDVTNMSLSPDGTHLIFRNKIDGYLWMLRIGE